LVASIVRPGPRRSPARAGDRRPDRRGNGLVSPQRITLDGAPAEPVDAEAKELATRQLDKLAARNAAKQAMAAKVKSKTKTKPAPETPAQ
jgi:hypothetical protein